MHLVLSTSTLQQWMIKASTQMIDMRTYKLKSRLCLVFLCHFSDMWQSFTSNERWRRLSIIYSTETTKAAFYNTLTVKNKPLLVLCWLHHVEQFLNDKSWNLNVNQPFVSVLEKSYGLVTQASCLSHYLFPENVMLENCELNKSE